MARQPFYETESPSRWLFGIWGWVAILIVVSMITSGALFAFGVVTAPWVGRGKAYQKQQSRDNRIFAQQQFQDLYNEYQVTLPKVALYQQAWQQTGDRLSLTNYNGIQAHCLDVVGEYNAASGKYLTKDFKDANLPYTLDRQACIGLK